MVWWFVIAAACVLIVAAPVAVLLLWRISAGLDTVIAQNEARAQRVSVRG